jgi:hypothetical protein
MATYLDRKPSSRRGTTTMAELHLSDVAVVVWFEALLRRDLTRRRDGRRPYAAARGCWSRGSVRRCLWRQKCRMLSSLYWGRAQTSPSYRASSFGVFEHE